MRDIKTREGFEFWDKLNALPRYAFLLSPSGKSVQKFEDQAIGNWIDVHEAQKIVDQAQDRINELTEGYLAAGEREHSLRLKLETLQLRLNTVDQRNDTATSLIQRMVTNFDTEIEYYEDVAPKDQEHDQVLSGMRDYLSATADDSQMNPCNQGHRDVGAAGGVAHCYTCDEKIEAATTQEAFERWNATHPQQ